VVHFFFIQITLSIQEIVYCDGEIVNCPHTGVIFRSAKVIMVVTHRGIAFDAFKQWTLQKCGQAWNQDLFAIM